MEFIAAVVALLNRFSSCISGINKLSKGKLNELLINGIGFVWKNFPVLKKKFFARYKAHFRLMEKYNPANRKKDKVSNAITMWLFTVN